MQHCKPWTLLQSCSCFGFALVLILYLTVSVEPATLRLCLHTNSSLRASLCWPRSRSNHKRICYSWCECPSRYRSCSSGRDPLRYHERTGQWTWGERQTKGTMGFVVQSHSLVHSLHYFKVWLHSYVKMDPQRDLITYNFTRWITGHVGAFAVSLSPICRRERFHNEQCVCVCVILFRF